MYVSIIYVVIFCRYATHVVVSCFISTNYGFECDLTLTMRTPSILAKVTFVRAYRAGLCYHAIAFSFCILNKFEKKILT
jgi:hypothetical protein